MEFLFPPLIFCFSGHFIGFICYFISNFRTGFYCFKSKIHCFSFSMSSSYFSITTYAMDSIINFTF